MNSFTGQIAAEGRDWTAVRETFRASGHACKWCSSPQNSAFLSVILLGWASQCHSALEALLLLSATPHPLC